MKNKLLTVDPLDEESVMLLVKALQDGYEIVHSASTSKVILYLLRK